MLSVEDPNHLFLLTQQYCGCGNRSRRSDPDRLSGQASFTKKIARSQNSHDRLFAAFIDDRKPDPALLDVQDVLARITLRKDFFLLLKLLNFPGYARRIEKILRIECRLGIGLQTM